jgi:murein L,D-transpeptidase YcbB/YkuD
MKPFFLLFLFFVLLYPSPLKSVPITIENHANENNSVLTEPEEEIPLQDIIREYINRLEESRVIKLSKQKIIGNQVITDLYKNVDFQPIWTDTKNRKDLIEILDDSYFEGLNPEDYHIDFIREHDEQLASSVRLTLDEYAIADIVMTNAILTYAFHMIQGKVHPTKLDPNWNYSMRPLPDSAEFRLMHRLETGSLKDGVDNIRSEIPMYGKLRKWFAQYDSIQKAGGDIQPIEYPDVPLRLGDSSPAVGALKRHMTSYGYFFSEPESDKFDEELDAAIKDFQMENGLDTDGVCGKKTYKALNISIDERLDIIRINMERCRWIDNDLPREFLLVNIADYHLYIFKERNIDYECKVVVGKEFHETPVFTSKIQYVVFNPTWTVPYSIASKEILPKLKKDPNYLQNRNMTLLRGDKVIDPSTLNFNQYSQGNFPFTIRQEPGPNNALGLVKFIFPNKYAVYLHDTPSKSYFEKTDRAFSHGCVRVKDPLVLAEQLLGNKGYNAEKIAGIIRTGKIQNVYLKEPMTVMLMYWTCYENNIDGKMYFYRDVYGRDRKLLSELNEAK